MYSNQLPRGSKLKRLAAASSSDSPAGGSISVSFLPLPSVQCILGASCMFYYNYLARSNRQKRGKGKRLHMDPAMLVKELDQMYEAFVPFW